MSTESRKESKLYLRSKEGTAGTLDTFDFFETCSSVCTMPPSTPLQESNLGKLGSGEFGTKTELQAIYTTFSIKCSRLSEFLYYMAFVLGKEDAIEVRDIPNGIFSHKLTHLAITSRTLPTFSAFYVDGSATNVMTHCLITDFTFTLANGGNGVIDATFNGVCNLHRDNSGTLATNLNSTPWSSGAYTSTVAAESLINYKGCKFFLGTATETVPLVHASVAYGSTDLSDSQTLTPYINSVTVTGNNGVTAEDIIRAGSGGVLNNQERKDYTFTLEMNVRKDDAIPTTTYRAMLLADTQQAIEIDWQGKLIKDNTYRYGLDMFFPVVQLSGPITEDDESPVNQTLTYQVYADSQGSAFEVYGQNKIGLRMNASHAASGEASTSQSASPSSTSTSQGFSSSLGLSSSSSS